MNGDVLARLYHRLGPRYPRAVLVVALRVPHLVLVVGVGVVALYVRMSLGEFALLAVAAVLVGAAYGNAVEFFILERALRPLFDDLSSHLSDEAEVEAISLPLSRRLLSALPALNVITGVVVVGVVNGGDAGLDTLGIA